MLSLKKTSVTEKDFIFQGNSQMPESFTAESSAPSNIALVKYWGKKPNQIPANPSISFTLSHCRTNTSVKFSKKSESGISFELFYEGKSKESFNPKIQKFLERIEMYVSFLNSFHLKIDTTNTFPHSSGIASSASGMAALSLNIMKLEKVLNPEMTDEYFYKKASFLARLGSGSACRSTHGNVVIWGENKTFSESSDLYGVPFDRTIHPNFDKYQDTILLVDKGEKTVSSTVGHDLMYNHPFAENRFAQAHENLDKIAQILSNGNLDEFIKLVESEALTLHAMMMASNPYFILMKPGTLSIIEKIWKFRNATNSKLCFTLDAGANVHLLYPFAEKDSVLSFITSELVGHCQNGHYICDSLADL